MAQKVTVVLEEDLTGGPAEETVGFGFRGHRCFLRDPDGHLVEISQTTST